ncbi:conjugal transfer protein TraI [Cytophagaceae bacterium DM2B3-1]|uniref:Conjugal transfer protein TraI n=1 Tax=Xanthocytophaga flava TaxID=3048013 RepID=A0ABT7CJ08_9BACT|nr:conjugal transfer protein TraI [Xanthocytophaga flavus]MDJ1493692.1 conjugal transfer protein TraI [Xanthocytophaga flavus]
MKKVFILFLLAMGLFLAPIQQTKALGIAAIIKAAVVKVIKAVDLKIQRQQNKVIWLQNAQKTLENTMSKLKLDQISEWVEKQSSIYKQYYDELAKVKALITYYQRIKDISQKQIRLVNEYKRAWRLFQQDKHFSPDELDYMSKVYTGILEESANNMDQILLITQSLTTKMTDAQRLKIIHAAADQVETNYYDLVEFNTQNQMLSLQRSKGKQDIEATRKLYGLH